VREIKMKKMILVIMLPVILNLPAAGESFEPQITPREAAWLEQAEQAAVTNVATAADLLLAKDSARRSAALDFALGGYMLQADRLPEAVGAYRTALRKMPDFRRARNNLALAYLQLGKPAEALKQCRYLMQKGAADAQTLLLAGRALLQQGDFVAAESAYRQVLLYDTERDAARQGLVRCLFEQERYKEARRLLESMLARKPHSSEFWSLLANVDVALTDYRRAIVALESARALGADTPEMNMLLGDLYLDAGQPADAVAVYQRAIAAGFRDVSRMLRAVEGMLRLGGGEDAAGLLEKIEKSSGFDKSSGRYLEIKADIAVQQGRRQDAVELYRRVLKQEPLNGAVLLKLGAQLESGGDLAAAEMCYERAERIGETEADALVRLGEMAAGQNDYAKAIGLLKKAQAVKPRENVGRYLRLLQNAVGD